ncbi:MAG: hypothetical protein IKF14_13880 [Atopobiaceae bacterium]|nr:hypothetical protein [Atopobiaceae bacterium]
MATAKASAIDIKAPEFGIAEITIVGTTPLVVHSWDDKARQMILDKQTGTKKGAKHEIKIPVNDFMNSLYWLTQKPENGKDNEEAMDKMNHAIEDGAKFGFPCNGIKAAIISGAYRAGLDVKMSELRGTFFIEGATSSSTIDIAEIVSPNPPRMREDMVRVGGMSKSADVRYRAEFEQWEIPLRFKYLKSSKYTFEQLLNMIPYGGFVTGIGEWRPEKNGQFGMFELGKQVMTIE